MKLKKILISVMLLSLSNVGLANCLDDLSQINGSSLCSYPVVSYMYMSSSYDASTCVAFFTLGYGGVAPCYISWPNGNPGGAGCDCQS